MKVLVEACVDSVESARAAEAGGADRLELCDNLDVGGTTPGDALVQAVKHAVRIPVFVMIRPRGGSFVHSPIELDVMRDAIDAARSLAADGLVFGVLDEAGHVDLPAMSVLMRHAGGTPVTFHRAFDAISDQSRALEQLVSLGVRRVLTGGGPGRAIDGMPRLAELVRQSDGRVAIMAGGKVRSDNARELVERAGVGEIHLRCESDSPELARVVSAVSRPFGP